MPVLRRALDETANRRGSQSVLSQYKDIVENIRENPQMRGFWERYQKEFDYASDISFNDACDSILTIMDDYCDGK